MDQAYNDADRLAPDPLLLVYGGNDQIIPHVATDAVIKELGPEATVKRYPMGYHMLLRDLEGAPRWADIAQWVDSHAMARVSAATGK
jgi:alpha-beta hydrolase superfamily lysophospholipase